MPSFGKKSDDNLSTAHPLLQKLFREVVKGFDCQVLEGHRGKEAQDKAFADGKSKLKYPNGNHNSIPSNAVDVAPYPIDWNDRERFIYFAGYVHCMAEILGIKIRYGGDWNGNLKFTDENFRDLVHFELAKQ